MNSVMVFCEGAVHGVRVRGVRVRALRWCGEESLLPREGCQGIRWISYQVTSLATNDVSGHGGKRNYLACISIKRCKRTKLDHEAP